MTAETAAVNDRRNTAPEYPIYECPRLPGFEFWLSFQLFIVSFRVSGLQKHVETKMLEY